jgi:hypothetical protein
MPLNLNRYQVAVARDGLDLDKALEAGEGDGYDLYQVTVLHADQLVAEQAGPRYGLIGLGEDNTQKMAWATLWVWCALRRMGVGVPEFPPFKGRVLDLESVTQPADTTPDLEAEGLGPTVPPPDTGSV